MPSRPDRGYQSCYDTEVNSQESVACGFQSTLGRPVVAVPPRRPYLRLCPAQVDERRNAWLPADLLLNARTSQQLRTLE